MASRKVLAVLLVCVVVSIEAAPLPHHKILRALSPLLNHKRSASYGGGYGNSYGSMSYLTMPSYIASMPSYMIDDMPSYIMNSNMPSYMTGGNSYGPPPSYGPGNGGGNGAGTPNIAFAMSLMKNCDDEKILRLSAAIEKLISSKFMESEEMSSVVGEQGQMVDQIPAEQLGMVACVLGNIKSLDDIVALANMSPQDEQMFRATYPMYTTMAEGLVEMLKAQKEMIDDEEAKEGIDAIVELYGVLGELGLLNLS